MPTLAESATVAVNYHSVGQSIPKQENDGLNSKRVDSVGFDTALSASGGVH